MLLHVRTNSICKTPHEIDSARTGASAMVTYGESGETVGSTDKVDSYPIKQYWKDIIDLAYQ